LNPMPDWLVLALLGVGTALNLFGLYCGWRAFVAAWDTYGEGNLWPWLAAAVARARSVLRRLTFRGQRDAHALSVSGAAMSTSSASVRVTARMGFPDEASDAERIASLVRAVRGIYDELAEDRSIANRRDMEVSQRLSELSTMIGDESRRLEGLSKEIASGDVRLQLVGLMAIGLGTVLMAIPGIWQTLASAF